nr:MAG TPA: glycoprotein [Caudoviricetes sp.]
MVSVLVLRRSFTVAFSLLLGMFHRLCPFPSSMALLLFFLSYNYFLYCLARDKGRRRR